MLYIARISMFGCACCSVAKYPGNPCLGHRPVKYGKPDPYQWLSYAEVGERVGAIAGAMMALGLEAHGRVGVYGVNSPEWMMAMQACTVHARSTAAGCMLSQVNMSPVVACDSPCLGGSVCMLRSRPIHTSSS